MALESRILARIKLEETSLEWCFRRHSKGHSNLSRMVGGIHFSPPPTTPPAAASE